MTKADIQTYLDSIGGLVNGHYTDRPPISADLFETENGWNKLILDLIKELVSLGWDRHIMQVKEKFGGLRFYIGSGSNEMFDVIDRAEELSFMICERCGDVGKPREGGWIKTLCNKCHESASPN